MGESIDDRLRMLEVLSNFDPPPESVPINCLMAMPGTPLGDQPPVDIFELVRLIAVTRIALPKARVRLAAGRTRLSREGQALCFFAGANSIFYGDKLLTAENPAADSDVALLRELGLHIEGVEEASRSQMQHASRRAGTGTRSACPTIYKPCAISRSKPGTAIDVAGVDLEQLRAGFEFLARTRRRRRFPRAR